MRFSTITGLPNDACSRPATDLAMMSATDGSRIARGKLARWHWMAAFAPAGTPPDIVRKVEDSIKQAVAAPEVRSKLQSQGMDVRSGTSEELRKLMNAD